jgi:hypothetical protein
MPDRCRKQDGAGLVGLMESHDCLFKDKVYLFSRINIKRIIIPEKIFSGTRVLIHLKYRKMNIRPQKRGRGE